MLCPLVFPQYEKYKPIKTELVKIELPKWVISFQQLQRNQNIMEALNWKKSVWRSHERLISKHAGCYQLKPNGQSLSREKLTLFTWLSLSPDIFHYVELALLL